ncbi:histidine decarboxylase [Micromonospora sp. WMMD736]|uniref:histidine decarboxylase n=1 Tax=Micromonospora sp. WMMD736 TaxID=3404112 RepID=UPI003B95318F
MLVPGDRCRPSGTRRRSPIVGVPLKRTRAGSWPVVRHGVSPSKDVATASHRTHTAINHAPPVGLIAIRRRLPARRRHGPLFAESPINGEPVTSPTSVPDDLSLTAEIEQLRAALSARRSIGFPAAVDIDYGPVTSLFGLLINNVGDPETDPDTGHTKAYERQVIDWHANLFRAPADDRWGYLTSGGTEANQAAILLARDRFAGASPVLYYSQATHDWIRKTASMLNLPEVVIRTDVTGEVDYDDLRGELARRRDRPAIVVANAGTTVTEAVDDPARVRRVLSELAIRNAHLHVDGALAGVPLALLPDRPVAIDLGGVVDSVAISSHKFYGTTVPGGLVVTRRSLQRAARRISYTATTDSTISGSRCGQLAVQMWYALRLLGEDGHRERAERARETARFAHSLLASVGWPAWRNVHAFTVYFTTPPPPISRRYGLSNADGGISHLICMPGVTRQQIEALAADIATVRGTEQPSPSRGVRRLVPVAHLPVAADRP